MSRSQGLTDDIFAPTMVPFYVAYPEVAPNETRVVTPYSHPRLGGETFAFVEVYCADPECDCRRLMINVIRDSDKAHVATVSWAFDKGAPDRGPFLDPLNAQSALAKDLLALVSHVLASDPDYCARLERHYRMMKEAVRDRGSAAFARLEGAGMKVGSAEPAARAAQATQAANIARNAPCPCGSGKKYKKCCRPKDEAEGRLPAPEEFVPGVGFVPVGAPVERRRGRTSFGRMALAEGGFPPEIGDHAPFGSGGGSLGAAMGEFIQPIVDEAGSSPELHEKAVALGMLFWNLALLPDDCRSEQVVRDALAEGGIRDSAGQEEFLRLAEKHIARHRRMFPHLHRDRV
ncbi:MAG: SEC-C domain-containing protein [Planctomycetes bacterium]|nr:SEC-C domain-containing protein [Planctomycetota bacterium]